MWNQHKCKQTCFAKENILWAPTMFYFFVIRYYKLIFPLSQKSLGSGGQGSLRATVAFRADTSHYLFASG